MRTPCVLALCLVAGGCAKVPVRAHLEECATAAPIERVTLRVIPLMRYYPTFPAASGRTDGNGDAVLRLPDGDHTWQCLFTWKEKTYSVPIALRDGRLVGQGASEIERSTDSEAAPCVRITFEPIVKR